MKEDIAKLWVEALRSGEYKQCQAEMRFTRPDGVSYCCLGVLTDVVCTPEEREDDDTFCDEYGDGYLNPTIAERCGVNTGSRCVDGPDIARNVLVKMNDEEGKSFSEIADYIEANWQKI